MTWHDRVERAKDTARLAGYLLGAAATVAALGFLWAALHDAEDEALLALFADLEADG